MSSPTFFSLSHSHVERVHRRYCPNTTRKDLQPPADTSSIETLDKFYQVQEALPTTQKAFIRSRKISIAKELKFVEYSTYLHRIIESIITFSATPPLDLIIQVLTIICDQLAPSLSKQTPFVSAKQRIINIVTEVTHVWSEYLLNIVFLDDINSKVNDLNYDLLTPQRLQSMKRELSKLNKDEIKLVRLASSFNLVLSSTRLDRNILLLFGCLHPEILMVLPIDCEIPLVIIPIPKFLLSDEVINLAGELFSSVNNWKSLDFKQSDPLLPSKTTPSPSPDRLTFRGFLTGQSRSSSTLKRPSLQNLFSPPPPLPTRPSTSGMMQIPTLPPPLAQLAIPPKELRSTPSKESVETSSSDSNPGTGRRSHHRKMYDSTPDNSPKESQSIDEIFRSEEWTQEYPLRSVQNDPFILFLDDLNDNAYQQIITMHRCDPLPSSCDYHKRLNDEERLLNEISSADINDNDIIVPLNESSRSMHYLLTFILPQRTPIFTSILDRRRNRYS